MNAPFEPKRQTEDYQKSDAAHHIHAFVDQKALNAEGPRVMVRGEGLYLWTTMTNVTWTACRACGAPSSVMVART